MTVECDHSFLFGFTKQVLSDVIVLYTVLDEIKHKSSSVFKKFREVIADRSRNFYTFVNEHHRYGRICLQNSIERTANRSILSIVGTRMLLGFPVNQLTIVMIEQFVLLRSGTTIT